MQRRRGIQVGRTTINAVNRIPRQHGNLAPRSSYPAALGARYPIWRSSALLVRPSATGNLNWRGAQQAIAASTPPHLIHSPVLHHLNIWIAEAAIVIGVVERWI